MENLDPQDLLNQLGAIAKINSETTVQVGYSGGVDSTALLHLLHRSRELIQFRLVALHVNHGIDPQSDCWEEHCLRFCNEMKIEFRSTSLELGKQYSRVNENTARSARYSWFRSQLGTDEMLLTAHHQNDQAETFLLNLMRGAGVYGLSAIQPVQKFASGWLVRPLLDVPGDEIVDYARQHGLEFLEDASNSDLSYERNYLRHEVLPKTRQRWPSAVQQIGRSAEFLSQTRQLVDDLAKIDIESCRSDGSGFLSIGFQLSIDIMKSLHRYRRLNLIRYWTKIHALPQPPRDALGQFIETALTLDKEFAELCWSHYRMYRYRDDLYLARATDSSVSLSHVVWDFNQQLTLEQMGIKLVPRRSQDSGLSVEKLTGEVSVRLRSGGERIRLPGRKHSSSLKKLFQQHGIPPWERNQLPLIYCEDEIAAVVPWLVSDRFKAKPGESGICIQVEFL